MAAKKNETASGTLDEDTIAKLKAEHGVPMEAIEAATGWLVFRKPTRHEYDRYIDKVAADKAGTRAAGWELAQSCIVHPGPGELTAAMDAEPALLMANILPLLNGLAGDERTPARVKL